VLKRRIINCFAATLVFLTTISSALAIDVPSTIKGNVRWKGEIVLKNVVTVATGATLTISPGTVVRSVNVEARIIVQGLLKVVGTSTAPVTFATTDGWRGIELVEAPKGSEFRHVRFKGAETAISSLATPFELSDSNFLQCATAVKLLREAGPIIERCLFADNDIAIDNEMKSSPVIRLNTFRGNRKTAIISSHNSVGPIEKNLFEKNVQAIAILQKYTDQIVGNRFIENDVAIFCNQTQSTPLIKENEFKKNKKALLNFSFSYPVVENNTFIENEAALFNDQYGSPLVVHNLFRENKTAVHNNRKANPKIEKNRFEKNALALFCDYSSYPEVRGNNFEGNAMGVELGIFQSADWEKRAGSKSIIQEEAASRRSQNPLIAKIPTEFNDYVDVSGNWWGKDTSRLAAAGSEGNVEFFFDRKDKPKITYEGYDKETYVLDRVVFSPWLKAAVKDAGPVKKK